MFNKKKFLDKYTDFHYDYLGNVYEVVDFINGIVILQDVNDDYTIPIRINDWDSFHNKFVIKDLEPLSESLQAELDAAFEKEFGPFEDDKEPITWQQFKEESDAMDKFVLDWRKRHGV